MNINMDEFNKKSASQARKELYEALQAIEVKDAKIAELEAAKTATKAARKSARAPKELVKGSETIQNADYVGLGLTLATPAEVLAAFEKVQSYVKYAVYMNFSGRVLVNGEPQEFKKLMPIVIHDGAFKLFESGETITPDGETFEYVRVVSMRKSVVDRYYRGIKQAKKVEIVEATEETANAVELESTLTPEDSTTA